MRENRQHGSEGGEGESPFRPLFKRNNRTCYILSPILPGSLHRLLQDPERFYQPRKRPSGHAITMGFGVDHGGALPSNLLAIPHTDSQGLYLRLCKHFGLAPHPARYPEALPAFFMQMLTDPGDVVLDCFAGSNTTGHAAERLARPWLSFECSLDYGKTSAFRFLEHSSLEEIQQVLRHLDKPAANVMLAHDPFPLACAEGHEKAGALTMPQRPELGG